MGRQERFRGLNRIDLLIARDTFSLDPGERGRRRFTRNGRGFNVTSFLAKVALVAGLGVAGSVALPAIHVLTGYGEHFKDSHNPDMTTLEKLDLRFKLVLSPTQSP